MSALKILHLTRNGNSLHCTCKASGGAYEIFFGRVMFDGPGASSEIQI